MIDDIERGIFVSELKNRFLCLVNLNEELVECYIPSSCRLSNFLSLEGKEVLLKKNQGKKTRTEYSVFAVKYKRGYLLLNLSQTNNIIKSEINRKFFKELGSRKQIAREMTIDGYKADLYIYDTKTIIEIKSLLTTLKNGEFPTVYSERANNQLIKILELLEAGYKACYMLVSLNPYVESVRLGESELEFRRLFLECVSKGMVCMAVSIKLDNGEPTICRKIKVII